MGKQKEFVPKKKRKEILQRYSEAVAHYQPLIEERFSRLAENLVSIGEVTVKDMKELDKGFRSYSWQECENPAKYTLLYPIIYMASIYRRNQAEDDFFACWFNQDLYLSFNHGTEILEGFTDQTVVHDLSHGLWEKLGGEIHLDSEAFTNPVKFKFVNEGFASYCEYEFFRDLYPQGAFKDSYPNRETYPSERNAIKKLVDTNGEKILLEIPTNWRRLI